MAEKKKVESSEEKVGSPAAKGKSFASLLVKLAIILVAVGAIGVGIYYYLQYDKAQKLLKNPTLAAQTEQKTLIDKVGKLIELPQDEEPTVATVSDITKLKGQPFFAKAQNGFKVLIYSKAKRAILYDPKNNKIIEVGPINIGQSADPQKPAGDQSVPPAATTPVNVAIYNGTKTAGLAGTTEKQIAAKMSNVTVVAKGNAKENYTKTLVIDLSGNQKAVASQLAKLLSGEVGSLPKTETLPASPAADLLIILGK